MRIIEMRQERANWSKRPAKFLIYKKSKSGILALRKSSAMTA